MQQSLIRISVGRGHASENANLERNLHAVVGKRYQAQGMAQLDGEQAAR